MPHPKIFLLHDGCYKLTSELWKVMHFAEHCDQCATNIRPVGESINSLSKTWIEPTSNKVNIYY